MFIFYSVVRYKMEGHRVLLLTLSDRMSTDDVQRLLFICPMVVFSEDINRGYQLFVNLERMGLLGPGNYSYLSERLKQIGRLDLDNMLPFQGSTISYVPTSFQAPWNTLETIFRTKERKMISFRDALSKLVNNSPEWEACMNAAAKLYSNSFTVQNSQLEGMNATPQHFSDAVFNAFMFTEEFTTNYLVYITNTEWPEPSVLQSYVVKLTACQKSFKDAVIGPRFNPTIAQSQNNLLFYRPDVLSDRACECIEDICVGLVDSTTVMAEMKLARERISFLSYCGTDSAFAMLAWLIRCAFLAATSQIDLKPYRSFLKSLAMKHKKLISEFHHSIATIIGHRVLQAALADDDIEATHSPESSLDLHQMLFVPWLSILILFVALGNENEEIVPIDPREIIAQLSKFIQQDKILQLGLNHAYKMALTTRFEIENLKVRIIKLCPPMSPLIKRLLALDSGAHS